MMKSAFVIIDVQNDFCSGGALEVPGGEAVIEGINALTGGAARELFEKVVCTADWHPACHISFASSHAGAEPYSSVTLPQGEQSLWPDHCLAGSPGADFHPDLDLERADLVLRKGRSRDLDSYSAFFENDGTTTTGLAGYLKECGITRVCLAGLALDWCVFFSAMDSLRSGFDTVVMEDLCRAVDQPEGFARERIGVMRKAGVMVLQSGDLVQGHR